MTHRLAAPAAWAAAALVAWATLIAVPLVGLYAGADGGAPAGEVSVPVGVTVRSFALAAGLAAGSVVLGYLPGRLLGTARRGATALWIAVLAPLLLPRYLLLYAWDLVRSPMTPLGNFLSARPAWATAAAAGTSSMVVVLGYWPLAALLIGLGWRTMDRDVQRSATLDASGPRRFLSVTLPLLAPALLLAFGVCFVLCLSEFATFHLAGVETFGTVLWDLYEQTHSVRQVAVAAWPAILPAAAVAVVLWRRSAAWATRPPVSQPAGPRRPAVHGLVLAVLLGITVVVPVALLAASVRQSKAFASAVDTYRGKVGLSLLAAAVAAGASVFLAAGALMLETLGRAGRALACVVHPTILLAALLPGGLIAASLVRLQGSLRAATGFEEGWYSVSAGLVARFAGLALILLRFASEARSRHLAELAATDGASAAAAWWHVHLPRIWQLPAATVALLTALGLVELQASAILLPPGGGDFAQTLLNQMHYARDQQVIAVCLMLLGAAAGLGGVAIALRAAFRRRGVGRASAVLLLAMAVALGGCRQRRSGPGDVVRSFGRTGPGPGEFVYPRAIDVAPDGTIWVADKTGRFQRFDASGACRGGFAMPEVATGKPTGFSIAPDGELYVADTHYHRVIVYSPSGKPLRRFGEYGTGDGQFIYPTDVAFSRDGTDRLFVSEYGGNDRVSVYTSAGRFLDSFGSFGSGRGQFSRPSALRVDARRGLLYVADACNHRIAVYDLRGRLRRYLGAIGSGPGQLRYPYDLALRSGGDLVVCEYGNNRIQMLSTDDGRSLAVYGGPGRALGRLAYPWGVAVAPDGLAYVVDAGNNRVQVWRLP